MKADGLFCPECGSPITPDLRFCGQCGGRLRPTEAFVAPRASAEMGQGRPSGTTVEDRAEGAIVGQGSTLTWEYGVPLLTNRFMLWDYLRGLVFSVVGLNVLITGGSVLVNGEFELLPIEASLLMFGLFIVLFAVVALLFYQNRYHVRFTVDPEGAFMRAGQKESGINLVVILLGVLGRRPGLVGAGLVSRSRETSGIKWREVHAVEVHPAQRVVSLADNWHTVLRLYCTPGNFASVVERVRAYASEGERWRAARPPGDSRSNLRFYLVWLALSALAAAASVALDVDELPGYALAAWLLVMLSGLCEGPMRRFFGALSAGAALLLLGKIAAILPARVSFAESLHSVYVIDLRSPTLSLSLAGFLLLLAMSVLRLIGPRPKP